MNSTKEAAKTEAIAEHFYGMATDERIFALQKLFGQGFDAGYESARDQWTAVEDGLPEVGQMVWVTRRIDGTVVKRVFVMPYSEGEFKQLFTAWMPAEGEPAPYQQG